MASNEFAIPVIFAFLGDLFATFLSQVSYLLMKYAHIEAEETQKSAFCSCRFLSALLCMALAQVFHLGSLPYLPLILVAINSATGIVMGAMLAVVFLKEKIVWRYDLVAFILISAGCTGIVLLTK